MGCKTNLIVEFTIAHSYVQCEIDFENKEWSITESGEISHVSVDTYNPWIEFRAAFICLMRKAPSVFRRSVHLSTVNLPFRKLEHRIYF